MLTRSTARACHPVVGLSDPSTWPGEYARACHPDSRLECGCPAVTGVAPRPTALPWGPGIAHTPELASAAIALGHNAESGHTSSGCRATRSVRSGIRTPRAARCGRTRSGHKDRRSTRRSAREPATRKAPQEETQHVQDETRRDDEVRPRSSGLHIPDSDPPPEAREDHKGNPRTKSSPAASHPPTPAPQGDRILHRIPALRDDPCW